MKYLKEFNIFDDIPVGEAEVDVVYSEDDIIIRRINSFKGSVEYGNSAWDISYPGGEINWKNYIEDHNVLLYFVEDRSKENYDPRYKTAIIYDKDDDKVVNAVFQDNSDAMLYVQNQPYFSNIADFV